MSKKFGIWLRSLRVKSKMTQKQMADALEIDQPSVSRLELGTMEPSVAISTKISERFNVPMDVVLIAGDLIEEEETVQVNISREARTIAQRLDLVETNERRFLLEYFDALLTVAERRWLTQQYGESMRPPQLEGGIMIDMGPRPPQVVEEERLALDQPKEDEPATHGSDEAE
jgi:transcriptional regulator with XRE-family HTH domain